MGIYDRDYQRSGYDDRQPGFYLGAPRMMTTNIILITFALYVAQLLFRPWIDLNFALDSEWMRRPWKAYQLLTYGFLHDPDDLKHILFNMFGLWLFGREIEERYGRREFLLFYLAAIVVAGLVWTVAEIPSGQKHIMMGASGGVMAVVILFACNFPFQTVLFNFILPMPMWVLAAIYIAINLLGALGRAEEGTVAFTAHLGGALFAFLYYRWGGRLERLTPSGSVLARLRPRPKLRVHDPDADETSSTDNRVDEILKKIQEHGQDSLTRGERRILEEASREYQKRRGE